MISPIPNQSIQQPCVGFPNTCEENALEPLQVSPMMIQGDGKQQQEIVPKIDQSQQVLVSLPIGYRPDGSYGLLHPSVSPTVVDRHSTFYVNQGLFHHIAVQQEMLSRCELSENRSELQVIEEGHDDEEFGGLVTAEEEDCEIQEEEEGE